MLSFLLLCPALSTDLRFLRERGGLGKLAQIAAEAAGAFSQTTSRPCLPWDPSCRESASNVAALPLEEMAAAATYLSQAGVFDRAMNGKNGRLPEPGMGIPRVTCQAQGMTCCIPNSEYIRKRDTPPLLNESDDLSCRVLYRAGSNEFCGTAAYDGAGSCGILTVETEGSMIYQTVLNMPRDSQNDARCECSFDLSQPGTAPKPFATWEVDVKAIIQGQETNTQSDSRFATLAQGVQSASQWGAFLGKILL